MSELRDEVKHLLHFIRRLEKEQPQEPLPPPLPPGRIVAVEGRGEMFVRQQEGRAGDATVVLVHGWALSADLNWFPGSYEVAARYGRVIAPDVRGHGRGLRSEKPFTLEAAADDIAALIDSVSTAPAVIVGYSMGGSLAMLCAARHPEVVGGLVLASTGLQWRATWAGASAMGIDGSRRVRPALRCSEGPHRAVPAKCGRAFARPSAVPGMGQGRGAARRPVRHRPRRQGARPVRRGASWPGTSMFPPRSS